MQQRHFFALRHCNSLQQSTAIMDTYNPEEAAPLVGMAASTIRNWCKLYAVGLSDGANPDKGVERRLTTQDIATMQQIKAWRDDRIPPNEIVTLLHAAATRSNDAPLTVSVTPGLQQTATEPRSDDLLLPVALSSMDARLQAVERQQATLLRAATLWGALVGVIVGLMLAALYMWGLYLFA